MTATVDRGQEARWARAASLPPATEVLVVGAGQAGLAIAAELTRRDIPFVSVDGAGEIASTWRSRWNSLRLFTPRRFSALPGLPLHEDPEGFPGKDEIADYLGDYHDRLRIPVHLRTPVVRLTSADPSAGSGRFRADTPAGPTVARQVVVATGPFQRPRIPRFAAGIDRGIRQVHASAYRNPDDLPDGPAMVVGGGNSGIQIAAELARDRPVTLAVGARHPYLPDRVAGRSVFAWLDRVGAMSTPVDSLGGRVLRHLGSREPLIGETAGRLRRRHGVRLIGRIVDTVDGRLVGEDGSSHRPHSVVWANGYAPDFSWIDLPVIGADGSIRHHCGKTDLPGLYTLGMPWQRTRGSALLGWVGRDAAVLAADLERPTALSRSGR